MRRRLWIVACGWAGLIVLFWAEVLWPMDNELWPYLQGLWMGWLGAVLWYRWET